MTLRPLFLGVGTLAVGFLLAGCGQHSAVDKPTVIAAKGVSGRVHGGQNPVTGAIIQLWQVNTTADGGLGKPLLISTVTSSDGSGVANSNANVGNALNTLPSGDFTITGLYTCPVGDALVYITASGGNPGLSAGTNNPQSQMVTALGSCNNLKTKVQFIEIDEQTTVATVASLYAFMSAYNSIGASPAHSADLTAAFALMNEYIDFQAATAPGPALPANYSASTGDLNLLANVLATCVNSAGGTYNDNSPCGTLFYQADPTPTNSTPAPTDVTRAALDIRRNYATSTIDAGSGGVIATLPTPQAPFQPASTNAPPDWTLPIFQLPSAPTFSPLPGNYSSPQEIRIQEADPSAIVLYELGDGPPTKYSPEFLYPFTLQSNYTIQAIAIAANGRASSAVSSATYTFTGVPDNTPYVQIFVTGATPYGSSTPISITPQYSLSNSNNGNTSVNTVVTFAASDTLGGSFSPTTCTITASDCTVMYTPTGTASPGDYVNGITATFSPSSGDTAATATAMIVIPSPDTLTPFVARAEPLGGLIQASDGNFYGVQQSPTSTVAGLGQVYRMDTSGNTTPVYTFTDSANGLFVSGQLVQGTDGCFYGAAKQGGFGGDGTLFKVDSSGNFTLLYTFTGSLDGATPFQGLVQGTDGSFYGTTIAGGAHGYGTAFKIDAFGDFTLLHAFAAGTDGAFPVGTLVQGADGNFYGTTDGGGTYNLGTIFKMDAAGNTTTLHSFTGGSDGGGTDGLFPYGGGLVQATDGAFYGTRNYGGPLREGTIFKIDSSGNFTTLHSLLRGELEFVATFVQGTDGDLYGAAAEGGGGYPAYGSLYKMDPAGNVTQLHQFQGASDGSDPNPSLIQGADGNFYGTDISSATGGHGALFKLSPSPALTGPITLTVPSSVTHGSPFTLTYTVYNASSKTMQQCFATNTAGDLTGWTGIKTASTSATNASLFAPLIAGTYTYTLTCGGVESGFATLNVK